MEIDPPSLETSDQVSRTSDDRVPSHVRSYECIFCKRGFTNAQALGGHMNIHRKDRAKLKQPSNDNKLTSNKKKALYSPISPHDKLESIGGRSSCTIKWPWIIPREDDDGQNYVGEVRQLALFVDRPMSDEDWKLGSYCGSHEERRVESSQRLDLELDLELRLGHQPCDTSEAGTIQFF